MSIETAFTFEATSADPDDKRGVATFYFMGGTFRMEFPNFAKAHELSEALECERENQRSDAVAKAFTRLRAEMDKEWPDA